jgi:F0F1-type ATP synthase membrane subunit c/vacuolar-type H+-ATPase subunit K
MESNPSDALALAAGLKYIGVGLTAFGFLGAALGVGKVFAALLEGISRNPSAQKQLMTPAFIGAAFAEFMGLLALVVGMVLIFVVK